MSSAHSHAINSPNIKTKNQTPLDLTPLPMTPSLSFSSRAQNVSIHIIPLLPSLLDPLHLRLYPPRTATLLTWWTTESHLIGLNLSIHPLHLASKSPFSWFSLVFSFGREISLLISSVFPNLSTFGVPRAPSSDLLSLYIQCLDELIWSPVSEYYPHPEEPQIYIFTLCCSSEFQTSIANCFLDSPLSYLTDISNSQAPNWAFDIVPDHLFPGRHPSSSCSGQKPWRSLMTFSSPTSHIRRITSPCWLYLQNTSRTTFVNSTIATYSKLPNYLSQIAWSTERPTSSFKKKPNIPNI